MEEDAVCHNITIQTCDIPQPLHLLAFTLQCEDNNSVNISVYPCLLLSISHLSSALENIFFGECNAIILYDYKNQYKIRRKTIFKINNIC